MPTLRERFTKLLMGPELDKLSEVQRHLYQAYLEGPYQLPPEELARQFREYYDPQLVADLLDQMNYEVVGGYSGYSDDERKRAVNDSKRMFKYSILARWMINLWTFYGLGENVAIIAQDEAADKVWQDFWAADRNQHILAKDRLDDISRWLLIKGERFFVFFASPLDGEPTIRNLPPEQITRLLTNPDDDADIWFYERQWIQNNDKSRTLYYPDWQTFFSDNLTDRWAATQEHYNLDSQAELANTEATDTCVLFASFLQLDEEEQRGWPLLAPHGTPWLRAQREFMQDRATVTKGVAAFIRRYKVSGGSRAVDSIRSTIASAFQLGATSESNPPPVAGSSEITNRGIDAQDLPLRTGASDAKSDGEMFSWMALLAGGLFPHYAGMGDAYRLATATAMERPLEMQFSLYRNQLGAMFRKIVRIVLRFHEGDNATFDTYEADVSTDRLVEIDVALIADAVSSIFEKVIMPSLEMGGIPDDARQGIVVFLLQTTLQALGAPDVQDLINEEMFEPMEEEPEDTELTEDKVEPTGQPLASWNPDRIVPISVEDVSRAIRNWERRMPPEAHGILTARAADPEEDASAARIADQEEPPQ